MSKKLTDHEMDTMLKNYCARRTQLSFDAPVEEKKMITIKRFRFAATALLIVMALSAGIFSNLNFKDGNAPEKHNGFFITANAAEINADEDVILTDTEFTPIGEIVPELFMAGHLENSSKFFTGGALDIHITCEGNNIEKLTYSVNNAVFFLDKNNSMLYDLKNSGQQSFRESGDDIYWDVKKDGNGYYANLHINGENLGGEVGDGITYKECYSEFTVEYENKEKAFEDVNSKSNFLPVEILSGYCCDDSNEEVTWHDTLEKMVNDITISIKATYTDGTSETKTLRLNCDSLRTITAIIEN